MDNRTAFGRRGAPTRPAADARKPTRPVTPIEAARGAEAKARRWPVAPSENAEDGEFRQWKRERRRNFTFPWRPVSLMASLCFGIASFVLPDSVNGVMQYLLYALMAASLYAGFRRRRTKTEP